MLIPLQILQAGRMPSVSYTQTNLLRNAYERDAGLRLDHLLLNKAVAPRLEAAQVDKHVCDCLDRIIRRQCAKS